MQPPPVDVPARCSIARRPVPAGSSATSASGATHTPQSASVPTLNCRRHASSRGPSTTRCSGRSAGSRSPSSPVSRRPVSAEEQTDLGVGRLAVLGDVQRHGVLVAVDEHQPDVADVIAQAGDDAQQRRAVTAVDEREPARRHRCPDPCVERVGHGQQCGFVDQAGRRAAGRIRGGQVEVVVVDHMVVVERVAQSGVVQHTRRAGLIARTRP